MTDKNQIKQYLQDRLQGLESINKEREWTIAELGDVACCKQTLAFIDSMQEEPISEDLDSFAIKYAQDKPYPVTVCQAVKVGAKWQKEQMMAKAIDAELYSDGMLTPIIKVNDKEKISDIKFGDEIKVIVIKKD